MYIVFFLKFGTHNTNLGGVGDSEYLNLLSHERRGFPTNENNRSKGSEARYLGFTVSVSCKSEVWGGDFCLVSLMRVSQGKNQAVSNGGSYL